MTLPIAALTVLFPTILKVVFKQICDSKMKGRRQKQKQWHDQLFLTDRNMQYV